MQHVILANPKRKRSRKGRMPAALKAYWAKRGRGSSRRKSKRSSSRRKSKRSSRSGSGRVTVVSVTRNPSTRKRSRRSFRRHAKGIVSRAKSFIPDTMIPAAVGASGALGIDMLWGYLPIPDTLKTGALAPAVRLALAALLGYGVGKLTSPRFGREVTVGAVTVTAYDLAKAWLQANVPTIPLSLYTDGLGYRGPAVFNADHPQIGLYTDGYDDSWITSDSDVEESAYYN